MQCEYLRAEGVFILNAQHAVNQSSLNQAKLRNLLLVLPPLAEQHRIVTAVDSLSRKSERARTNVDHIPRLVEKYKQAILAAAFRGELTRKGRNGLDEDWDEILIGELFQWASGKNLPIKRHSRGNIPVIGGNGINGYHDTALIDFPTLVIVRVGALCGNVHRTDGPSRLLITRYMQEQSRQRLTAISRYFSFEIRT